MNAGEKLGEREFEEKFDTPESVKMIDILFI